MSNTLETNKTISINLDLTINKNYNIIMYNDDTTDIGFVVACLCSVFKKTPEEATKIAYDINGKSFGIVATYENKQVAEKLKDLCLMLAKDCGFFDFRMEVKLAK